jgi:hypothetical protein
VVNEVIIIGKLGFGKASNYFNDGLNAFEVLKANN